MNARLLPFLAGCMMLQAAGISAALQFYVLTALCGFIGGMMLCVWRDMERRDATEQYELKQFERWYTNEPK